MNKAFVKESEDDEDDAAEGAPALPEGVKNYITPAGYQRLRDEFLNLIDVQRPEVVRTVSWAASNGDRSENGDYIYGKRRLREIDRRIRFLTQRLDLAEIVDPARADEPEQAFFGATVNYRRADGSEATVTIVGVDEAEPLANRVSWISPIARSLLKARVGERVMLNLPDGSEELLVLDITYPAP